jgi:putative holliday junction resolvase
VPEHARGRVLGLDLGAARIGLAISDDEGTLAVPLGTIRTGAPQDLRAVSALVQEHDVARVVVGNPLLMSGETGEASAHASAFAEALRALLHIPVDLHDERLSTVEAERRLGDAGISGKRRRRVVDQTAAVVILQSYLDARKP